MQMFPFKHIPAVPVCGLFTAQHLAQFSVVIGEVDENLHIHIPGTDGVEAVDDEDLYLAEISVQLVNFFGDDVNAGDRGASAVAEIFNVLVEKVPVVFVNTDGFIVAADAVFTPIQWMDAVVVVGMENFDAYAALLEQQSKRV